MVIEEHWRNGYETKGKETFPDIVATVSLKDKNDIENSRRT